MFATPDETFALVIDILLLTFTKDQMVVLLGKELIAKGKVRRKDLQKVITKDNLVLANGIGKNVCSYRDNYSQT